MSYFKVILSIVVLLLIDLISKYAFFDLGLLPDIFRSTFNTGISFSIAFNQVIIQIISLLFIISISVLVAKKKINAVIAALLIAWALGNLLDRFFLGWVRDFIWLGMWPIFNAADIYISLGACYAIIFELIETKNS